MKGSFRNAAASATNLRKKQKLLRNLLTSNPYVAKKN